MGELDLCKDCYAYNAAVEGYQNAFLTVLVTWVPLAVAGIALGRTSAVHATMRGAGPLRVLARLAIAIQVAALTFSLLFVGMFLGAFWGDAASLPEIYIGLASGLAILPAGGALSVAGIRAWHRVLIDLASHRGASRMLV